MSDYITNLFIKDKEVVISDLKISKKVKLKGRFSMSSHFSLPEKSTRNISEFEFLHDPNDKSAKLGVGSFATVKLAREKKTGKLFALKIVSR